MESLIIKQCVYSVSKYSHLFTEILVLSIAFDAAVLFADCYQDCNIGCMIAGAIGIVSAAIFRPELAIPISFIYWITN